MRSYPLLVVKLATEFTGLGQITRPNPPVHNNVYNNVKTHGTKDLVMASCSLTHPPEQIHEWAGGTLIQHRVVLALFNV